MSSVAEIVTDRIIKRLDSGIIPWHQSWSAGLPCNGVSGHEYRGINLLMLGFHENPRFYTFNQVKDLKESVKKGAKGIPVVFWKMKEYETEAGEIKDIPLMRYYTVFNEQDTTIKPKEESKVEPIKELDLVYDEYEGHPNIKFGQPSYSPSEDMVYIPDISKFDTKEYYYSVLYHELIHSTGHEKRLSRNLKNKFGSEKYSEEELVAEFGASILCAKLGIDNKNIVDNSVAYIQSWSQKFRENKNLIIQLAGKAQKAVDYILEKGA
jgi:antirestriction protein ArdC